MHFRLNDGKFISQDNFDVMNPKMLIFEQNIEGTFNVFLMFPLYIKNRQIKVSSLHKIVK